MHQLIEAYKAADKNEREMNEIRMLAKNVKEVCENTLSKSIDFQI